MFYAVIKRLIFIAVITLCTVGCGKSNEERAQALFNEAMSRYEAGDYAGAMMIIDSISDNYTLVAAVRRGVMHLKPQVIEKETLLKLSTTDSLAAITRWKIDSLSSQMKRKSNAIETYFTHNQEPADINETNGLYARMSTDATLYVIAVGPYGTNNVSVVSPTDGASANTTQLKFDGERNDEINGHGVLTYMEGDVTGLIDFIKNHAEDERLELIFKSGSRVLGKQKVPTSNLKSFQSVIALWEQTRALKLLEVERAKLERILEVSRNQTARTMSENNTFSE